MPDRIENTTRRIPIGRLSPKLRVQNTIDSIGDLIAEVDSLGEIVTSRGGSIEPMPGELKQLRQEIVVFQERLDSGRVSECTTDEADALWLRAFQLNAKMDRMAAVWLSLQSQTWPSDTR